MKLQKGLILLLWLAFLLGNAACFGPQAVPGDPTPTAGLDSQNTVAPSESETKEYIHGWTFPTAESEGTPSGTAKSKENRERMLPNETDQYIRAWTFPPASDEAPKKPSTPVKPHRVQPQRPPVSDTEEFINGWSFE